MTPKQRPPRTLPFNRRFWPQAAFEAVLGIGGRVAAPSYAALYEGTWTHPGGPLA